MGATFTLKGSGSGAVKAVQDFQKALKAAEGEAEGTAKATSKVERMAQRLADKADPMRKYNREMQELGRWAAQDARNIETAELAAKQLGTQLERAGDRGRFAFGEDAARRLAGYAAGMFSIGTAISQVNKFFADTEQRAQAAADKVLQSLNAFGELQQLGAEELGNNAALARQFAATGAFADDATAAKTAFNVRSSYSDAADQAVFVKLLQDRKVSGENIQGFAGNVKKLQNIFGTDGGDTTQVINKLAETSKTTQVGASETAEAITAYARLAQKAGLTDEETLALFATGEGVSKNPAGAAEKFNSFFNQVNKRGLGGGGLDAILARIQSKVDAGANVYDVLGEGNAVQAFDDLQAGRGVFASALQGIVAAENNGLVQQSPLLLNDPELGAALVKAQSEGRVARAEAANESVRENLFDTYRNQLRSRYYREGRGAFERYYAEATLGISDLFGSEDSRLEGAVGSESFTPEFRLQAARYLRDQGETSAVTLSADQTQIQARKLDEIIALLERQLGVQEKGVRRSSARQE